MVIAMSAEESERRCRDAGRVLANPEPGEEVVISGCAGRFPDSDDVNELRDHLYAKQDLISADARRWNLQHDEIPQRTGKVNFVNKFDAAFFGVHYKQAHTMDPLCRMLLERTYEAIVDAGVNPKKLEGSRCGVFIGSCFSESEKTWFYERMNINGFGILGSSRAMLSNRISFWLGIHGPSYTVDSACSSSLYALEHAYKAIREGICDSAIVGGCNLCLHPYVSLQFSRLGVLSPDGSCKAFDNSANGYCRAEAIAVVFLQRAKDAKRVYATIVHAKTNCDGYKEQGITYPSGEMQQRLLEDFYKECDIDPRKVAYIEAHGTGTKVGDPEECNALDHVFCNDRQGPLLVGSVKSNLGHTEPASGVCSIIKVVIAMENLKIPPNLHFSTPKEGIPGFVEGRLQVVSDPLPWEGGLAGVNSFGFGGANCHVLMKWNSKDKVNNGLPVDNVPRLIAVSGRTEEAVKTYLDDLESRPIDVEYVRLFHDIHSENIAGHNYRGFIVISNDRKIRDVQYYPGKKRPIWLIFSGLGSQWPTMGKALLKFNVFAAAIERCAKALQPKGVDLMKVLTSDDTKVLEDTVNKLVGVVAVQIGLVDILHTLGIFPENMIGHSIGELGCSYADGSLSAEQAVLAAYYRGLVTVETEFIRGGMTAVGMGYNKIKNLLPPEIEVACHNGPDACTITGPTDILKSFVSDLVLQGVFTKEVPSSNIAYHSRYVSKAGPKLLNYLQKVIPQPKARSTKWVSTSVPENKWKSPLAKLSSAEYHTNNFLCPVLFEEAISHIPYDAITIEVAPHGLLQPILRRALNKITSNVALTQRGHADNAQVLLTGIGKLYELGLEPQLANLYPAVEYPVSRGTPMISPLVRWDHRDDWFLTSYRMQEKIKSGERTVRVSAEDEDWTYVQGHVIDGRNLFPATGYVYLVWETLSMMRGEQYTNTPVVFENIKFNRATTVPKGGMVEFTVMIQKGSGAFEVIEGGVAVVTGRVYRPTNVEDENVPLPKPLPVEGTDLISLQTRDIYKELRLRGYNYSGLFRGLQEIDVSGRVGKISWNNNWVAFMDNMLQIQILHEDTRGLYVPTFIQKIIINPKLQVADDPTAENPEITIYTYENIQVIKAGGVEIRDLKAQQIPRRKPLGDPVLEKYQFMPHYRAPEDIDLISAIRVCLHLALENLPGIKVKVMELGDETVNEESILLAPLVAEILGDLPLIQAEILVISNPNNPKAKELGSNITVDERKISSEQNCLAVVGSNILNKPDVIQQAIGTLRDGGFIIARENVSTDLPLSGFNVLVDYTVDGERILLLTKKPEESVVPKVLKISVNDEFSWLPVLKEMIKDTEIPQVLVVAENEETNGLIGFVNCIRKEPDGEKVRGVFILDKNAPAFDYSDPFYVEELKKGSALSVLMNGEWGSFRHQALPPVETIKRHHGYINNAVRGDLSSFKFFEGPLNVRLSSGEISSDELIQVYYCSINFRDVMLASGKLSTDVVARGRMNQDIVIGFEFSGRTASGKRVMGMLPSGAMASEFSIEKALIWEVPDAWTLAEAATVPVVYGTVRSALLLNGRMKKGDTVLIHAGTGGVGLAAIITCLKMGATVYTTVGTQEKRDYIRENFPEIPDSHIGNSRDTSFEHMIKRETNGRGVDLVLNSLSEEKLQASIRCLAKGGRFIEIGKFDIANNNPLGMEMFAEDASFHAVMLDLLFTGPRARSNELLKMVGDAMPEMVPLKYTCFGIDEVEQAFRFMAGGKHMGKVIIKLRDEEEDALAKPVPVFYDVVPKFYAAANKSYIVTGGLGGFGLELADWLALRGARNIVVTSRKGLRTGYQALRIKLWRSYGANVVISTDDITTEQGVTDLLKRANELGPVDAIFNLAVVLRDALVENLTEEDYNTSFGPKAVATQHLDVISRRLCPQLEHFVIFSSVSCGRGNAGQTNYGMANSVMERICEKRKKEGLPALAIQWGAIGEVGLVAEMQEEQVELVIGGTLQQTISSCLQCMDTFLKQDHPVVASMVVAEKRAGGSGAGNIVDTVIGIMGIKDLKTVSLHSSLAELGMDSMMAVEIKQTLEREFEVFLTAQDIRGLTFAKLAELDAKGQGVEVEAIVQTGPGKKMPQGIGYLLRLVQDESFAQKRVITVRGTENCSTLVPIFLIPGLEGMASVFDKLSTNLLAPAHCLQFPYKNPSESMQSTAAIMLPELLSLHHVGEPITLLGYSTGAMIALEMAFQLESAGHQVKLILVDGSPEFLQFLCKAMNVGETEEDIQNSIILGVYNVLVPGTGDAVREELKSIHDWQTKLKIASSKVPAGSTMHSEEHRAAMMIDLYHRMKNVMEYKCQWGTKIQSQVTLIRPSEQMVGNFLDEDYNLSKYCARATDIAYVEGNHLTMLDHPSMAKLINAVHTTVTPASQQPPSIGKFAQVEENLAKQQQPNLAKAL